MTLKTIDLETLKPQQLLDLAQFLTPADQLWLAEQLNRLANGQEEYPYFIQYGQHTRAEIEALNERLEQTGILAEQSDPNLSVEYVHYTAHTTLAEAIGLYLLDKCSLGRAAELAGVTRWDIMDVLAEHNIPTNGGHDFSPEEVEEMVDDYEEIYGRRE